MKRLTKTTSNIYPLERGTKKGPSTFDKRAFACIVAHYRCTLKLLHTPLKIRTQFGLAYNNLRASVVPTVSGPYSHL